MTEPAERCSPACSEQHTYSLGTCALACAERYGGVADQSWAVPCSKCGAPTNKPCRRRDGTAVAVSCGPRWDAWEQHQKTPTPAPVPADVREQIAAALMSWAERNNAPQYAAIRRPATVVQNAYSRADAVLRVPAIAEALAVVERVRQLHQRWDADPASCAHCVDGYGTPLRYPCPTIRVLEEQP